MGASCWWGARRFHPLPDEQFIWVLSDAKKAIMAAQIFESGERLDSIS